MNKENYLVAADKVEMEDRKTTNEPNGYEAIKDEDNWQNIMGHGTPQFAPLMKKVDPRENEHVNAQEGWRSNETYEERVITLHNQNKQEKRTSSQVLTGFPQDKIQCLCSIS